MSGENDKLIRDFMNAFEKKDVKVLEEFFHPTDLRALTPLIWEHVNPYGRFELNMETRLDLSPNGP
jgi:hypothetical protein